MWIKGLVSNAAVFPAVGIMLLIGAALVGGESVTQMGLTPSRDVGYAEGVGWVPPLMTSSSDLTGVNAAMAIVGIGIILLLPEVAKLIKELLGMKEGIGGLLTGSIQSGWGPVGGLGARGYGGWRKTMSEQEQLEGQYAQTSAITSALGSGPTAAPKMSTQRAIGRTIRNMFGWG